MFEIHDSSTDMTLQLCMWVSWTSTLHYIYYNSMAHSNVVAEMTWHDSAGMFMMMVVSMSNCNAVEWWVCSWCIIASPSHGKVYKVFNGLGVHSMFHMHVSPSLLLDMLHVFICSWTILLACVPFSYHPSLQHVSCTYLYWQSLMMRQHKIHKSPSLPWCIIFCF